MYDVKSKKFYCNRCKKEISTYETYWTKWQFPPKINSAQEKSLKALENQNASILCLKCANDIFSEPF